jgi:membrane fusion protein, multidrug efflux system
MAIEETEATRLGNQPAGEAVPATRADAPRVNPRPTTIPPTPAAPGPRRRRGWVFRLIVVVGLIAIAMLAWRLFGPGSRAPKAPAEVAQPVGVAKVGTADMRVIMTGLGTVTPMATITVQTQISGQLMSVGYQEGQIVHQGDLLAQIDPRPYEVSLQQAEGALAHDTGLLAQARSDLARYMVLAKRNSIAEQTVTDQQFLVQQYEGTVLEDQATVASSKLNLVYCRITSPVTGRVGLRLVDPGNYVQTAGATGLVVVTQLQPISVIFVLPEDDIPAIAQEMNAGQPLAVGAYDRTNASKVADGTLLTIDNTVDTTTGTVKLRASFSNTNNALFPNEFVNARLLLKTLPQVVQAPTAAIQNGAPGTFVYLVKPDGTVGVQVVHTGVTDGDEVQIVSGLKQGDTVVVDGADRLKDGARVKVTADPGNSEATQTSAPGAAPPGPQDNAAPAPAQSAPGQSAPGQSAPGQKKHHRKNAGQGTGQDSGSGGP